MLYRVLLRRVTRAIHAELGLPAGPLRGTYTELAAAALLAETRFDAPALTKAGLGVVSRIVPRYLVRAMRSAIHSDRISGKIAVLLVPPTIAWLVGPVRRRMHRTQAIIERCRLLDQTSPTVCYRFCKAPSEAFLTERLNVPIRMEPEIATGRCTLTFGPRATRSGRSAQ